MKESQQSSPLAANLRKWRERRGMSASALAREAGISKSTVSELERGNGNPSLDTLWSIAKTLNVSLGSLLADPGSIGDSEIRRLTDAPVIARDGDDFVAQLMAGWHGDGEVELSVVSLAPNALRSSRGNAAGVIERVLCASGLVEVGPEGAGHLLEPGDMLTFRADQPHFYRAREGGGQLFVVQQYPSGN
ncbi:helix-turn-helix domain-containing protein [Leucobacter aridicollis]|uniref:helix-turn-helix domain-containing protein n=1 Tax=Leucobacter aridicollis TaxID=283878 RepID=UPI00216892DC|nr:XRE family transcriptional regulator [Leucobacter aridicollis]MCS3427382.1 transcriptional regulator with XRE-family HTH domain [Leucobacter aridicollis]